MIEEIILNHLTAAGITAYTEIPEGGGTPPFVVIQKTGGGEEDHIRHATVAIQSYGATLYAAASLNEAVIAAMGDILAQPEIGACELNSDYNFTDTSKRIYRYQAVFELVHY